MFSIEIHSLVRFYSERGRGVGRLRDSLTRGRKRLRRTVGAVRRLGTGYSGVLATQIISIGRKRVGDTEVELSGLIQRMSGYVTLLGR